MWGSQERSTIRHKLTDIYIETQGEEYGRQSGYNPNKSAWPDCKYLVQGKNPARIVRPLLSEDKYYSKPVQFGRNLADWAQWRDILVLMGLDAGVQYIECQCWCHLVTFHELKTDNNCRSFLNRNFPNPCVIGDKYGATHARKLRQQA